MIHNMAMASSDMGTSRARSHMWWSTVTAAIMFAPGVLLNAMKIVATMYMYQQIESPEQKAQQLMWLNPLWWILLNGIWIRMMLFLMVASAVEDAKPKLFVPVIEMYNHLVNHAFYPMFRAIMWSILAVTVAEFLVVRELVGLRHPGKWTMSSTVTEGSVEILLAVLVSLKLGISSFWCCNMLFDEYM